MLLSVHAACDRGLVRANNEDMILAAGRFLRDAVFDEILDTRDVRAPFFAVADGLGGAAAGEEASEAALRIFLAAVESLRPESGAEELKAFFSALTDAAHAALTRAGREDPRRRGMGTTLTAFLEYGGRWYWFNAGDSRAYLFRAGSLIQLSRDHSLREVTGRADIPSNILANCLGGGSAGARCDFAGVPGFPREGDALLLSSDGLHDLVGNGAMEAIIAGNSGNPVPALVEAAKDRGGRDNISCIYLKEAKP